MPDREKDTKREVRIECVIDLFCKSSLQHLCRNMNKCKRNGKQTTYDALIVHGYDWDTDFTQSDKREVSYTIQYYT